jgi:hypothetical protein
MTNDLRSLADTLCARAQLCYSSRLQVSGRSVVRWRVRYPWYGYVHDTDLNPILADSCH